MWRRDGLWARHTLAPIGLFITSVGVSHRAAFWSAPGFALIAVGTVCLVASCLAPSREQSKTDLSYPVALAGMLLLGAARPLFHDVVPHLLAALALAAFVACFLVPQFARFRLVLPAALVIAAHAATLVVHSDSHSDVYVLITHGVSQLGKLRSLYETLANAPTEVTRLPYPPGIVLLAYPFQTLLGDFRWAFVAAEVATTLALRQVVITVWGTSRGAWQDALILFPLSFPRATYAYYVLSNYEWLLVALAAGAVYFAVSRQWLGATLLVALGIATKQYFIVFPMMFFAPGLPVAWLAAGVLGGLAIVGAFAVQDLGGFLTGIRAVSVLNGPNNAGDSLWSAMSHFGMRPGRLVSDVLWILAGGFSLAVAFASRRRFSDSLLAAGVAFCVLVLFSPYGAYSYYLYGLSLTVMGLLVSPSWNKEHVT